MITANEGLSAAAQILNTQGWAQGTYETDNGRHCLLGALQEAMHIQKQPSSMDGPAYNHYIEWENTTYPEYAQAKQKLAEVLSSQYQRFTEGLADQVIVNINDFLLTSQDEAVAMLEKAAVS